MQCKSLVCFVRGSLAISTVSVATFLSASPANVSIGLHHLVVIGLTYSLRYCLYFRRLIVFVTES